MFVEKLNKKQEGFYVIEEEKAIQDGKWEGYLEHDNVSRESIVIYTGPNFTGTKVDNFFISIPSETPWKTHLKVFSNSEKIYITYESQGDQVEAEDINLLQNTLIDEINRAKTEEKRIEERLNDEITRAITEDERLDVEVNKKANKTYVDTELNKRYTKDEVFNKQEVLQKIQDLIGAAPEALDTLEELARALDNDPNFATNIINLLSTKVDKVTGKGLSTEDYTTEEKQKLAGIEEGANKYIHPDTHPASMITESSTRRFVSDDEKNTWNTVADKADKSYVDAELNKKAEKTDIPTKLSELTKDINFDERYYTETEIDTKLAGKVDKVSGKGLSTNDFTNVYKNKLDGIEEGANKYIHPDTHPASMIVEDSNRRFVSDADKTVWNDAASKRHTHSNKTVLDTITQELINTWNNKAEPQDIPTKVSQLENDAGYVTEEDLSGLGQGDMLKSVYDKDNDGVVDKAKTVTGPVTWNQLKGEL